MAFVVVVVVVYKRSFGPNLELKSALLLANSYL